jgi:hypothetical protein
MTEKKSKPKKPEPESPVLTEEFFLKVLRDNKGKGNTQLIRTALKQPPAKAKTNQPIRDMAKALESAGKISINKTKQIATYILKSE